MKGTSFRERKNLTREIQRAGFSRSRGCAPKRLVCDD